MTTLTFFGGINEIGGNKILLEDGKARIWLDFGISFGKSGEFYSDFLSPRKYNGLGDFFEMGLLPDVKGLYRGDFLKKSERKAEKPAFDGVFVTHAHVDHTGLIPLLHKDIPIFCGDTTRLIMKAMQDTTSGFETEFLVMKEHFTGLSYAKVPRFERNIKPFRTGDKINVKGLEIRPIHVDHSIPGAYGFIIHTSKGPIVYTGDIRAHGTKADMTEDFIKAASKERPTLLICEGTRIDGAPSISENDVRKQIASFIAATKGLVVANFPPRDIDRFNTFFRATKENGRKLVINFKQAYLLKTLAEDKGLEIPKFSDKNILIYMKRAGDGSITEGVPLEKAEKEYDIWQRDFLGLKNSVTFKDIQGMQKEVVFYCDNFSLGELIDIKPMANSTYIYSLCEPFNDEMSFDFQRVKNWIEHFKLKYLTAHASGHASLSDLKEIVSRINPKAILPVHTQHSEMFAKVFKTKVITAEIGKPLKIA